MRPTVASWLSVISTQGDAAGPRSATAGASSTLTGPLMASLSQPAASGPAGPAAIPPGCLGECPPEPLRHAGGGDRCGGVQPDGKGNRLLVVEHQRWEALRPRPVGSRRRPLSLIHISEPTRLLSISYAVFCLKKKNKPPYLKRISKSSHN